MGLLSEHFVIDTIPVEVRRNKRRRTRIGMVFDPRGYVIMDAPVDTSEAEIRSVVSEHYRWLRYRLTKVQEAYEQFPTLHYENGEIVHYLGSPFMLCVKRGASQSVVCNESSRAQLPLFSHLPRGELRLTLAVINPGTIRDALNGWYRERAQVVFTERFERWASLPWLRNGLPEWRHAFMRSQWGSCSTTGKISVNTHLIKTPGDLIDYVLLHELCHLKHHNHGKRFYALMSRHMEDWEFRRKQLNRYLPVLVQE